jgi:hypothetical protein
MGKQAKLEAADKPPGKRTVFEKLTVPLSDREVSELGIKHAEARVEYLRLEKEKHEMDVEFNAKLKTLDAEQDSLARQVNARSSEIDVECEEIHDDARKMVEVWRLAPRELLKTREMTVQEKGAAFTRKQPGLPGLLDGTDLVDDADRATAAGARDDDDADDEDRSPNQEADLRDVAKNFVAPSKNNDLGLPGRGDENGPADEEPEEEDDGEPIEASGEEEPPEGAPARRTDPAPPPDAGEIIEHKGQSLRRVPRGPRDPGNGQPEAPKR